MGIFEEKLTRRAKPKRLSFITQFKIEFLLPFTSCRKVLGKMPDRYIKKFLKSRNNWLLIYCFHPVKQFIFLANIQLANNHNDLSLLLVKEKDKK